MKLARKIALAKPLISTNISKIMSHGMTGVEIYCDHLESRQPRTHVFAPNWLYPADEDFFWEQPPHFGLFKCSLATLVSVPVYDLRLSRWRGRAFVWMAEQSNHTDILPETIASRKEIHFRLLSLCKRPEYGAMFVCNTIYIL